MAVARIALAAAFLAICAYAHPSGPTGRILGGEEVATLDDLSYVASVRLDYAHICGGSIIASQYILTAAHCVYEHDKVVSSTRLSARVGSTNQFAGGKIVYVADAHVHPSYSSWAHDIAILKLSAPLTWSDKISAIPYAHAVADQPAVNAEVTVAGWGDQGLPDSPYKLAAATFKVASDSDCTDAYSANDESITCLAHDLKEGACTGDAGNGGIYQDKLVVLSNFVIGACGSRYPDIYLNVAPYAEWIDAYLK